MPLLVTNYAKGHQNTDVSSTLHEGVCYYNSRDMNDIERS